MSELQEKLAWALQLQLTSTLQKELQPMRQELGEIKQAVAEQGTVVGELAGVVSNSTAFMLKVSAANKRCSQQLLAIREQLNRASGSADQVSVVSQDDPFQDAEEEYDPAHPTDTQVGEPVPPGLKSPAFARQI